MSAHRKVGNDGVALIVALFAIIILTALVVTFAAVARTDVLLAGNRTAMTQARCAAQSSLNYCRVMLATYGADSLADQAGWTQEQDVSTGATRWECLNSSTAEALDISGYEMSAVVEDESSRLNLNTATESLLMALPGMTQEAAEGVLDWRDANENARPLGAESDYYRTLPSPYEAANGPFQTVDELRLVRGVDAALFDGDGTAASPGLGNLVTVRSGEQNVDRGGGARLSVNTADSSALSDLFASLGFRLSSRQLDSFQSNRPYSSLGDVLSRSGVAWRTMAQALDRLRTNNSSFVEGTVNLNTAGEPVLEAIGLPAEVAQALVEQRASAPLATKGDLAGVPGVTRAIMIAAADRIATQSSIFRVRAFARAESRPLHAGVFALVDRSGQPPRVLLWREDFDPMPALSTTALAQLRSE